MFESEINYRSLRRWKYQLLEPVTYETGIDTRRAVRTPHLWVGITRAGLLSVKKGYCWDGPSGPTYDSESSMRASLLHDALYQLMRQRLLSLEHRAAADDILYRVAVADGMWRWRAAAWRRAVKWFAEGAARPEPR